MLKLPILGGDGDATPQEKPAVQPAPPAATPPPASQTGPSEAEKALKAELEGMKAKNKEMEEMLLHPTYLEFMAQKDTKGREETTTKLNEMDNAELVAHITEVFGAELEKAVGQINNTRVVDKAAQDIVKLRKENEDFDLYKDEMIRIAEENPTLTAARVYKLAKLEAGPRQPKKVASGDIPSNTTPGNPPKTKGFREHFDRSWKESGIGKILKEVS